jgi:acetolactate synthase-1/2/3 large subunit
MKNHISACLVTTGPGSTNAITGVAAAWVDSIPMIIISGQVKREIIADYSKSRQLGPQEINIIDIVKPITKYAVTIMKPEDIRYQLEKAIYLATSGRPGPVWINIPLDVQSSTINDNDLIGFDYIKDTKLPDVLKKDVEKALKMLKNSRRPLIIGGNGVRLSGAQKLLASYMTEYKIPIVTDENGLDLISEDNPLYMGRYGPKGQRRANFTLQNSDLVLAIGASLNITSTGFDYKHFAPNAKIIMVNIDKSELDKFTLKIDLPINLDAKEFLNELLRQSKGVKFNFSDKWKSACKKWKEKYNIIDPLHYLKGKKYVNSYVFASELSELLDSRDAVVTGMGLDVVSIIQSFKVKKRQRVYVNKNFGQMGWCLPAAIGACIANGCRRTILVTGDGSLQFNIQELATIAHYKLPVKIFVFNNFGYKSIRDTQNNLFEGRLVGADISTGVSNPDFSKLAQAYNLSYEYIKNNDEIRSKVKKVINKDGPVLCEVNIAYNQPRIPRSSTFQRPDGTLESRPLEDLFPFLPREEIWENMHIFDNK